jgi:hypothetical protein
MVLLITYWPLMLALLIVPVAVGYWIDRRGSRHAG